MRLFIASFLVLVATASAVFAADPASAPSVASPDGSLDIFCIVNQVPDLGCCEANTLFDPGSIGIIELSVQARLAGATAAGISGAEFYVEGLENLPGNWSCSVIPNPASTYVGDLCNLSDVDFDGVVSERRGHIVFNVNGPLPADGCQVGDSFGHTQLATIRLADFAAPSVDLPVLYAQVVAGAPPSAGPGFDCPLLTLCDAPVFTKVCVTGGVFVINNAIRAPINPSPADSATAVPPIGTVLSWEGPGFITCTLGTEIVEVHFGTDPDPPVVSTHHHGTTYDPGPLEPFVTYSWRVTRRFEGQFVSSPVWSFTTHTTVGVEHTTWTGVKGLFR